MESKIVKATQNNLDPNQPIPKLTENGFELTKCPDDMWNLIKDCYNLIKDKADDKRKVFFVSGNTATSDREAIRGIVEKQKNAIIVASLGTFSTGINIRNLHNIVFASPSKSQIRVLQSIGRGLRKTDDGKHTTLYDIVDDISWKSRKNFGVLHADERLRIYGREKFNHRTFNVNL